MYGLIQHLPVSLCLQAWVCLSVGNKSRWLVWVLFEGCLIEGRGRWRKCLPFCLRCSDKRWISCWYSQGKWTLSWNFICLAKIIIHLQLSGIKLHRLSTKIPCNDSEINRYQGKGLDLLFGCDNMIHMNVRG